MAISGFHQLTVLGHVGRTPELSITPTGKPVVKFSIAVTYKGSDGKEATSWYNCTAWNSLAEMIDKYVKKGQMVLVVGRPEIKIYETRDGRTGLDAAVTIEKFSFAGGSSGGMSDKTAATTTTGDDFLPDALD